jgi:hypothetical protein
MEYQQWHPLLCVVHSLGPPLEYGLGYLLSVLAFEGEGAGAIVLTGPVRAFPAEVLGYPALQVLPGPSWRRHQLNSQQKKAMMHAMMNMSSVSESRCLGLGERGPKPPFLRAI